MTAPKTTPAQFCAHNLDAILAALALPVFALAGLPLEGWFWATALWAVNRYAQATIQDAPPPVHLDYLMSEDGVLVVATRPVDSTSFNVTRPPEHGSLEVDAATGQLSYTPDSDYNGTDSFVFRAVNPKSGEVCRATVSW